MRAEVAEGTSEIRRTLCGPDLSGPDYLARQELSSFGEPSPNPTIKRENMVKLQIYVSGIFRTGPVKISESRDLARIPCGHKSFGYGELLRTFLHTWVSLLKQM